MTEVNYRLYNEDKEFFFKKHNSDFNSDYTCETSPMTNDGVYIKTYIFTDGSCWYERMSPKVEIAKVSVHGVEVEVPVKLQEVEYWSSDISSSRCYYERW